MSNFTDFFESGGGGGIVATPGDLPRSSAISTYLYIKKAVNDFVNSELDEFWTYYARQYAVSVIPADINNYTTLVDASSSNGGVLYHIIAPSQYYSVAAHQQYIKITIDGEVTEIGPINMPAHQYRAFHPVLGALIATTPSTGANDSQTSLSTYNRWFDNNSNYRQSLGFWAASSQTSFTVPTPSQADLMPKIKFNSTLKVEVKGYTSATYKGNMAGCAYKLY